MERGFGKVLGAVDAALDALRSASLDGVSTVALGEAVVEIDRLVNRLRRDQARVIARFDAAGGCALDGLPTTASWLRARTTASPGESAEVVRLGRALRDRLPNVDGALSAGDIGWRSACVIEAALRPVRDEAVVAEAEALLAAHARELSSSQLHRAARRVVEWVAPDAAQRGAAERYEARCLTLSPMLDGAVAVSGQLDEESAAVVLSAMTPLMTPLGPDDRRTAGQRRADALVELVGKAAADGASGDRVTAGLPPTLLVRVDVERLAAPGRGDRDAFAPRAKDAGRGAAEREASCLSPAAAADRPPPAARTTGPSPAATAARVSRGAGTTGPSPAAAADRVSRGVGTNRLSPTAAAHLDWAGPILSEALERIGCSAQVVRVVTAGASRVLDVGTAQRLATPAQRIALNARDDGCRFPGCDRPPGWTDAHHAIPWTRGGPTDLTNLISLCRFHHRLMHEGGWTLRRSRGRVDFSDPQGTIRASAAEPLIG